jgi:hypothetical protein
MRRSLQTVLGLTAGTLALLLLDPRTRRGAARGSRRLVAGARERLPALLQRKSVADRALEVEVRATLDHLTERARALDIAAERGCVVLKGSVLTEERARIVREVARMRGVDSVVDLMTERHAIPEAATQRPHDVAIGLPMREAARVVGALSALGLALAGARAHGWPGVLGSFVGSVAFTAIAFAGTTRSRSIDLAGTSLATP